MFYIYINYLLIDFNIKLWLDEILMIHLRLMLRGIKLHTKFRFTVLTILEELILKHKFTG